MLFTTDFALATVTPLITTPFLIPLLSPPRERYATWAAEWHPASDREVAGGVDMGILGFLGFRVLGFRA